MYLAASKRKNCLVQVSRHKSWDECYPNAICLCSSGKPRETSRALERTRARDFQAAILTGCRCISLLETVVVPGASLFKDNAGLWSLAAGCCWHACHTTDMICYQARSFRTCPAELSSLGPSGGWHSKRLPGCLTLRGSRTNILLERG